MTIREELLEVAIDVVVAAWWVCSVVGAATIGRVVLERLAG